MNKSARFILLTFSLLGFGIFELSAQPEGHPKEVVCFVYHRVGDARYPSTNISVSDFEAHLKYLIRNNFRILTLSQAAAYVQSDDPTQKTAVITIDDGYKSFYKNGFPLLRKYNLPATLYINTETAGAGDYVGWDEIVEMQKAGVEIGNHTVSHQYFLNLSPEQRYSAFKDEIDKSQKVLREKLGVRPTSFSYPYGEYDTEMKEIVRSAGMSSAVAQNSGVMSTTSDFFAIPRFPMSEAYASLPKFVEKASAHALPVSKIDGEPIVTDKKLPQLRLSINADKLDMRQFQCFIQGTGCEHQILKRDGDETSLTISPSTPLSGRRRTLCTITVRGIDGQWYWYSFLWINPSKK